jgi:hypothetical protein
MGAGFYGRLAVLQHRASDSGTMTKSLASKGAVNIEGR